MTPAIVVGDVMLDRLVIGRVTRISPEAPVPIFEMDDERLSLGGAGNVFQNLLAQSVKAFLVGVVGVGNPGNRVHELAVSGINLVKCIDRKTTQKTRFVADNGQHVFRVDKETRTPINEDAQKEIVGFVDMLLTAGTVGSLVLSDYDKGVCGRTLMQTLIQNAHALGWRVLAGPKHDLAPFVGADVVCLNWQEFAAAYGSEPKNPEAIGTAAWALASRYNFGAILITLGVNGAWLVRAGGPIKHYPAPLVVVRDVTGAGDTVLATLAARLNDGDPLPEAVAVAMDAAGLAVSRLGTVPVRPGEF